MKFWRVTSASSAAQFYPGEGFRALNKTDEITLYPNSRREAKMLLDHTTRHLEWGNRIPTSLISTYSDDRPAKHEAQRRVQAGEEDVILWEMELDKDVEDDVEGDKRMLERHEIGMMSSEQTARIPRENGENWVSERKE
ncbi:unnamed protein product [Penicillium palitans]